MCRIRGGAGARRSAGDGWRLTGSVPGPCACGAAGAAADEEGRSRSSCHNCGGARDQASEAAATAAADAPGADTSLGARSIMRADPQPGVQSGPVWRRLSRDELARAASAASSTAASSRCGCHAGIAASQRRTRPSRAAARCRPRRVGFFAFFCVGTAASGRRAPIGGAGPHTGRIWGPRWRLSSPPPRKRVRHTGRFHQPLKRPCAHGESTPAHPTRQHALARPPQP